MRQNLSFWRLRTHRKTGKNIIHSFLLWWSQNFCKYVYFCDFFWREIILIFSLKKMKKEENYFDVLDGMKDEPFPDFAKSPQSAAKRSAHIFKFSTIWNVFVFIGCCSRFGQFCRTNATFCLILQTKCRLNV